MRLPEPCRVGLKLGVVSAPGGEIGCGHFVKCFSLAERLAEILRGFDRLTLQENVDLHSFACPEAGAGRAAVCRWSFLSELGYHFRP